MRKLCPGRLQRSSKERLHTQLKSVQSVGNALLQEASSCREGSRLELSLELFKRREKETSAEQLHGEVLRMAPVQDVNIKKRSQF